MVALVLLGAGASYGSNDVSPHPPPVGRELFNELDKLGGVAASLPEDIKNIFKDKGFEAGMSAYAERTGEVTRFQLELGRYLSQFKAGPHNTYVNMLNLLGASRVVYSSLNYDLLLEDACNFAGIDGVSYSQEMPSSRYIKLFKPHGSCNFWPNLGAGQIRGSLFVNCSVDVQATVQVLDPVAARERFGNEDSISPAISMYAEGKAVKVCPDFVNLQQQMWVDVANKAKKIFVIGVKIHREDEHIWGTLINTKSNVYYVARTKDSVRDFYELKKSSCKRNLYLIEGDFESSIPKIARLVGK